MADRVLAVAFQVAPGSLVAAVGTCRRLQALVAVGWGQATLARRLGWSISQTNLVVRGRTATVVQRSVDQVVALYAELWDQSPPAGSRFERAAVARARAAAERYGWVPPMAWDDDAIDDPAAEPDRDRPTPGGLDLSEVAFLLDFGLSPVAIASRLGVRVESIDTAFYRAGDRQGLARWKRAGHAYAEAS